MDQNNKNGNDGKYRNDENDRNDSDNSPTHPSHSSHSSHTSHISHTSHTSHSSNSPIPPNRILPSRGDYRTLLSYQKAEVVYDITFRFCHRFLPKGDRTIDQMIQTARSGKQNIVEGSRAGAASKETEIKLTNVARASFEELLEDYRDYLRARDLPIWDKDSREAQCARELGRRTPQNYEIYRDIIETRPPGVIANIAICLTHQANYLLDQQRHRLEQDFVQQGGLRERMTRARLDYRNQHPPDSDPKK